LNGCFSDSCISNASSAVLVHVASLSADVGLIRFADASHLASKPLLHSETDALQHEPCGFLSYTKRAMQFVGTNTVLAIGRQPHCGQPLIKTNRGIFKDRSNFGRKLLLWVWRPALPNLCVF